MRAVTVFTVTRRGVCVRVRVLPTIAAVDCAYRGGKARRNGEIVLGYTVARAGREGARITLPLKGWTPGLVAHEVTHVADSFGYRDQPDDEPMAEIVGELTDSICARMAKLEAQCA